ncbi:MAG: hypothetical protein U0996_22060 [Planctomycetaceae bacterium]
MDYHTFLLKMLPGQSPYRLHVIVVGALLVVGSVMYASVYNWSNQQAIEVADSEPAADSPRSESSYAVSTPSAAYPPAEDYEPSEDTRLADERFEEQQRIVEAQQQQLDGLANSGRAVQKARLVRFQSKAKSVNSSLVQLRESFDTWEELRVSLEGSEAGRRIVGSEPHFQIVQELWAKSRPSADQISGWEAEVQALTENVNEVPQDGSTLLEEEHLEAVEELAETLATESNSLAEQVRMLKLIQQETLSFPAGKMTLVTAMESDKLEQQKSEIEMLRRSAEEARRKGLEKRAAEIAKVEEDLATAKANDELAQRQFEKKQLEDANRMAAEERERQEVEKRLEAEMARDMNEIRGLLHAYTSDGYAYRPDDTKGPVSLSLIRSSGGLKKTRNGLQSLFFIARGNSDRDPGGLPEGVGGHIASATPLEPIERAQELLIKYGDLMVKKGMLAP